MKVFVVLSVLVTLSLATSIYNDSFTSRPVTARSRSSSAKFITNGTFLTNIDHFRPRDTRKATFIYHSNTRFYKPSGPLYIYIKQIGEFSTKWIEEGLMVDIAEQEGGALFTFDQRYMGDNRLTETASLDDLQYNTVEQILGDIVEFVHFIREFAEHRVILWGSQYGATLATWARKRYPHIIDGVWSSSGIYDIGIYTFHPYDSLYNTIRSNGDTDCALLVREIFEEIKRIINEESGGSLQEQLLLCNPIDSANPQDVYAFFESHYQFLFDFIAEYHGQGLISMCRDLRAFPNDPLASYARWLNFVFRRDQCYDHSYAGLIARSSSTEWSEIPFESPSRQWFYLTCTQLGLFVIADDNTWIPDVPLNYFYQRCMDIFNFGSEDILALVDANAVLVSSMGKRDQRVGNVIYTNGDIDPWIYTGIYTNDHPDAQALRIESHSTSAELSSISVRDTVALLAAKNAIINAVHFWSII